MQKKNSFEQQQKDLDVEILYVTEQGEIYQVPKRKFKNK